MDHTTRLYLTIYQCMSLFSVVIIFGLIWATYLVAERMIRNRKTVKNYDWFFATAYVSLCLSQVTYHIDFIIRIVSYGHQH